MSQRLAFCWRYRLPCGGKNKKKNIVNVLKRVKRERVREKDKERLIQKREDVQKLLVRYRERKKERERGRKKVIKAKTQPWIQLEKSYSRDNEKNNLKNS